MPGAGEAPFIHQPAPAPGPSSSVENYTSRDCEDRTWTEPLLPSAAHAANEGRLEGSTAAHGVGRQGREAAEEDVEASVLGAGESDPLGILG